MAKIEKLPQVTILRCDNRIVVSPTTPKIHDLLAPTLTYVEHKHYRGYEGRQRRSMGLSDHESVVWECYTIDHKGRIATSAGFIEMITQQLSAAGYAVNTRYAYSEEAEAAAKRLETVYKPRWDRIDALVAGGFQFRHRQREILEIVAANEFSRVSCPPGYGKGTIIRLLATLFPKSKIDVLTKNVAVLRQRLYPELAINLPSVGIIGGGKRIINRRVMCITADSAHHGRTDADWVVVDEGHQACADRFAMRLGMYERARMCSFSASWDQRLDNKDLRAEAMFGPVRIHIPYEEAEQANVVSPIEIRWRDVIMDENPASDTKDDVEKKRLGLWSNAYRNKIIAADALSHPDEQVLIVVETLEHALYLKTLLPGFKLMYSPANVDEDDKKSRIRKFRKLGLIGDDFVPMTHQRKDKITRLFEQGKITRVIATTVWNVGVNFTKLRVLIRADGGGSPINDTQIPGRNSRLDAGKVVGIVYDYLDQFDKRFDRRAKSRGSSYAANGWTQVFPDPEKRSSLRKLMNWPADVQSMTKGKRKS